MKIRVNIESGSSPDSKVCRRRFSGFRFRNHGMLMAPLPGHCAEISVPHLTDLGSWRNQPHLQSRNQYPWMRSNLPKVTCFVNSSG